MAYGRQNIDAATTIVVLSDSAQMEAWCSGLTCSPVKAEIAGSNPVASAR